MATKLLSEYQRPRKEHYKIFFFSWAGWVFDFYSLILFTFLIIPIGRELELSNLMLSYILGTSLAASALGGVIFGLLSDHFGRKKVLKWTIITYGAGTFLSGIAPNFETLIFFRIITGFGVGGEWAAGQTYIGETFPPKLRGRFGALMQTGAPIGIAIAAIMGGFVAPEIGWRAAFFLSALPAVIIIYYMKDLPESDMWLVIRELEKKNAVPVESRAGGKFLILFSKSYRKIFAKSLILSVLDMSAYWFTYSWLPGYLTEERNFSFAESALWMIVIQAGAFIGYLTFGLFADWLGRRPAYTVYSIIRAVGLAMITVLWDLVAAYPPVILSFMFLVGFGTGMFSGYGPLFAELFPTTIRNTAMGSAFNLARGVQFFTPVIIALIAEEYGLSGGIFLASFFALLTGAWIWTFPETKGRRLDEQVLELKRK